PSRIVKRCSTCSGTAMSASATTWLAPLRSGSAILSARRRGDRPNASRRGGDLRARASGADREFLERRGDPSGPRLDRGPVAEVAGGHGLLRRGQEPYEAGHEALREADRWRVRVPSAE